MSKPVPDALSRGVQDDLIYDVGAHLGEDSAFYLALGYRVIAVEADPGSAAKLRNRFAREIGDGRLILVEAAISSSDRDVIFHANPDAALGSANPAFAECNRRLGLPPRPVTVRGIAFDALLSDHGVPHYLKVDIEGSDRLCLEGLRFSRAVPDFVSVEASDWHWRDAVRDFKLLQELGYTRFKIVRQGSHGSATFVSRSGQPVSHGFDFHSSGPFGPHLRGEWLTMRSALRRYFWIFLAIRLRARETLPGWLLCRIPLVRRVLGVPRWYDIHAAL